MSEAMKINHFHLLLRRNALQTFRNIYSAKRPTLEDILAVFRRKYVEPESQATAKHKWHKLIFGPKTMKVPDFLDEYNQVAEKAFGKHAQAIKDSLLYAKLPPKLKRAVNMALTGECLIWRNSHPLRTWIGAQQTCGRRQNSRRHNVNSPSSNTTGTRPLFIKYRPGNLSQLLQETRSYQKLLQKTETKGGW